MLRPRYPLKGWRGLCASRHKLPGPPPRFPDTTMLLMAQADLQAIDSLITQLHDCSEHGVGVPRLSVLVDPDQRPT